MEIKTLKGFKDSLPKVELMRKYIMKQLTDIVVAYSFDSIDTPILEYSELLLKKGSDETEKQTYRFKDNGGRDVSMRFDLTVPFARFVVQHKSELKFPFKRYQVGKVFRGEKTQKGRYREFTQFDFDIVGDDSAQSDFEILSIVYYALAKIFLNSFEIINQKYIIHFSNIRILTAFFKNLGLDNKATFILRNIDKIDKIGFVAVKKLLLSEVEEVKVKQIMNLIYLEGNFEDKVFKLKSFLGDHESIKRLEEIYEKLQVIGIEQFFNLNLKIARGLDYYTGLVFETEVLNSNFGSVASGGRYDDLVSSFTKNKQKLSGVGGSFGIDRLEDLLVQGDFDYIRNFIYNLRSKILIVNLEVSLQNYYHELANKFRFENNFSSSKQFTCEVYYKNKKGKNIDKQIAYAFQKGIRFLIFVGQTEFEEKKLRLKDLNKREESVLSFEEVLGIVRTCYF